MNLFKKEEVPVPAPLPIPEAEFDIEGMPVFSVERMEGDATCFGYRRQSSDKIADYYVRCSIEKHNDFVRRLREKLKKTP